MYLRSRYLVSEIHKSESIINPSDFSMSSLYWSSFSSNRTPAKRCRHSVGRGMNILKASSSNIDFSIVFIVLPELCGYIEMSGPRFQWNSGFRRLVFG